MADGASRQVTEPAVAIEALSKRFDTGVAIEDLTFSVGERRFVSLVGPSGCGKSTALRIIAGLVAPTGGSVRVRGREVTRPIKDVGMVFQSPVLLPWRRTLDNILFTAEMRGENVSAWRDRALSLMKLAGLDGFERSYPHELSGGMQQRVSICRALLLEPSLLLMDEPFGALDIITRERMGFELQRIWTATQNTVLLVTHSIAEAVLLSDTVVAMTARPGRVRSIVDIDLPRPRGPKTLTDPRFVELSAEVRESIEAPWIE